MQYAMARLTHRYGVVMPRLCYKYVLAAIEHELCP